MQRDARRAAIAAYKKRESLAGVFAVRSTHGDVWIGYTPDIDTIRNRIWFTLRAGGHMNKALQAAWDSHGEAAFDLEPLELVDADALGFTPDKVLRARAQAWRDRFSARAV